MKLAIIGAGNVGSTLGRRWARNGHEVLFGVRDAREPKVQNLLASIGPRPRATTVREAALAAPVIVLCTPWPTTKEALRSAGSCDGKILVDCTNPLWEGLTGLEIGHATSAAEQIASWVKGAKVVKAFNTTGARNMDDPVYAAGKLTMFLCGDDAAAKKTVGSLAAELDFEVVDAGDLKTARYLEPMAMLWIHLAFACGHGVDFGFRLVKR